MVTFEAEIPVSGYGAGQSDFGTLLDTLSQGAQDTVRQEIADRAANAEEFEGQFFVVTVVGHSDRDDTPGLTPEQRRESERSAARKRADSAVEWLFQEIRKRLLISGLTPPATLRDFKRTSIFTAVAGAADLEFRVPASEAERKDNRRVVFLVAHFMP
ncbi:hypothetical protein [Streptomyces bambusae]|uniref:Uncharacterized protein n=1 Tax=Streptomyces bambusae TaxID=1550616 RepID=A0ABS6Z3V3_9ACTN|nr:hypothetical protein [Streptomyces bambusae]MBW5482412.1 hypothetical protein [Streptomyces bambusae]